MHAELATYIERRIAESDQIPGERRQRLAEAARFACERLGAGEDAACVFICTHNSRRSQMAQIWAHAAAAWYGIPHVRAHSGGTEATAFEPRAVAALRRAGFQIHATGGSRNPVYVVRFGDDAPPLECFSKLYDRPPNPAHDFCAIMTCSQADADCPTVTGASLRIAISYDDPKAFDGSEQEANKYDERCRQIAREMLALFSQVGG